MARPFGRRPANEGSRLKPSLKKAAGIWGCHADDTRGHSRCLGDRVASSLSRMWDSEAGILTGDAPPHPLWCSALSLPLGEQGSYGLKRQSQKDEMPPKQGSTVGRLPLLKHGAISTLLFSLFKLEELFIMFPKDRPKQITGGVCLAASSATVTLLGT